MSYVIFKKMEKQNEVYGGTMWDSKIKECPECGAIFEYKDSCDRDGQKSITLKCSKCQTEYSNSFNGRISRGSLSEMKKEKRYIIISKVLSIAMVISIISLLAMFIVYKSSVDSSSSSSYSSKKACIACDGAGRVQQYYTNDPYEKPHWERCALCKGTGYSND